MLFKGRVMFRRCIEAEDSHKTKEGVHLIGLKSSKRRKASIIILGGRSQESNPSADSRISSANKHKGIDIVSGLRKKKNMRPVSVQIRGPQINLECINQRLSKACKIVSYQQTFSKVTQASTSHSKSTGVNQSLNYTASNYSVMLVKEDSVRETDLDLQNSTFSQHNPIIDHNIKQIKPLSQLQSSQLKFQTGAPYRRLSYKDKPLKTIESESCSGGSYINTDSPQMLERGTHKQLRFHMVESILANQTSNSFVQPPSTLLKVLPRQYFNVLPTEAVVVDPLTQFLFRVRLISEGQMALALNERSIYSIMTPDPNILSLYHCRVRQQQFLMIQEFYQAKLSSLQQSLSVASVKQILRSTIQAIQSFHRDGIAHTQINCDNIVVVVPGVFKVRNFCKAISQATDEQKRQDLLGLGRVLMILEERCLMDQKSFGDEFLDFVLQLKKQDTSIESIKAHPFYK